MNKIRILLIVAIAHLGLLADLSAHADDRTDALLSRVAAAYERLPALRANIRVDFLSLLGEQTTATGHIKLFRPNLARLELVERTSKTTEKVLIVSDGKFVWEWRQSANRYAKSKADPNPPRLKLYSSWLNLYYDPLTAVRSRYGQRTTQYLGINEVEGHSCQVVKIIEKPIISVIGRTVSKLYIDDEFYVRKVEVVDGMLGGEATTVTTFDYVDRDLSYTVDPSDYVFQPPKGARPQEEVYEAGVRTVSLQTNRITGKPPLIEEALWGRIKHLRILLDRGADVHATDRNGETALMVAASGGYADVVKLLLDRGAKVNAKNPYGQTALIHALEGTSPNGTDTARLLIRRGADVNARNIGGGTPLMIAASHGRIELLELLIARGTDVNARAYDGFSALMKANRGDIARILLRHGAQVNIQDRIGQTPLTFAARCGQSSIIRVLLEFGADVNAREPGGRTALSYALNNRYADIAEMLRDAGAKQ